MSSNRTLTRRGFLGGLGALTLGTSTASVSSPTGDLLLSEMLDHERLAAQSIRTLGEFILQLEQSGKEFAVAASEPIADAYRWAKETTADIADNAAHIFDIENLREDLNLTIKWIRPIYKFMDVIEGVADVSLPTLPLYRALLFGAKLSSIGGVILALKVLGEAAVSIVSTVAEATQSAVPEEQYENFYISLFISVAEVVLFVFPVSFSFAWRGTRWATNHLLFRLRRLPFGNQILALIMSFVHWVLRDVPSEAIYNVKQIGDLLGYLGEELQRRAKELEGVEPPSVNEIRAMVQSMYKNYLGQEIQVPEVSL